MTMRVVLDPIACDGHGLCAALLPERITLDEWGYPVVDDDPVSGRLVRHAKRAVNACPALALSLERAPATEARRATRSRP